MALLDLLGRRWALRVMWELRSGPLTFRELRERCDGMSPSVLNDRLLELREADIVEHHRLVHATFLDVFDKGIILEDWKHRSEFVRFQRRLGRVQKLNG